MSLLHDRSVGRAVPEAAATCSCRRGYWSAAATTPPTAARGRGCGCGVWGGAEAGHEGAARGPGCGGVGVGAEHFVLLWFGFSRAWRI
jgi:hypothetical protein